MFRCGNPRTSLWQVNALLIRVRCNRQCRAFRIESFIAVAIQTLLSVCGAGDQQQCDRQWEKNAMVRIRMHGASEAKRHA